MSYGKLFSFCILFFNSVIVFTYAPYSTSDTLVSTCSLIICTHVLPELPDTPSLNASLRLHNKSSGKYPCPSNAFRSKYFSIRSSSNRLYRGGISITYFKNTLSANGTRASSPAPEMVLSERSKSK